MRLDILHLFRSLRRSPASALAAVLTLSLTLGAGAAIFAVVDAVVLTPPPFANPEALVIVRETPATTRPSRRERLPRQVRSLAAARGSHRAARSHGWHEPHDDRARRR